VQESLAAAGITPGGKAPASDFIAAIKQGCGVSPQLACHYGSSDAEEVEIPDCLHMICSSFNDLKLSNLLLISSCVFTNRSCPYSGDRFWIHGHHALNMIHHALNMIHHAINMHYALLYNALYALSAR